MADTPTYKIPSKTEPTFWNRDTAVGFAWLGPIGAIVGGLIGKSRLENEKTHGKEVGPPTFWNKTTLMGAGFGSTLGYIAGLTAIATFGMPALLVGIAAGMTFGGLIGGTAGKSRLSQEYDEARAYVQSQQMQQGRERNSEYTVTPEMAQLLEQRLAASQSQSAQERILQERAAPQQQILH